MLAAAPHGLRAQLLLAAAEQLPLASGSLDLVTATMVWHWLDQARAGAEMARLLRPGGEIWILNFWFPGELPGEPTFAAWHRDVYHGRLPSPPRRRHALTEALATQPRLQPAASYDFSFTVPFSAKTLGDYLTTQSNIEAALRTYEQFNLFQALPRWNGELRIPVDKFIQTTAFGQGRSINGGPVTGQHSGVDLAADAGTPIHAAAAGRVAWTGAMPIRGNSVLLDHGAGVVTGYHHLLEIDVTPGQIVDAGDVIAKMGSTGFSTGPHLHWEMTIYGVNVDPMTWTKRAFLPE